MASDVTKNDGSPMTRTDGTIDIPISAVPDAIRNSPHPDQTRTYTLKRGDEEVQVTAEKLVEMAQKGWNADAVTQQARETIKEYEKDHGMADDLRAIIQSGDVDAFRRMGATMGIPGDEVEKAAVGIWGDGSDEDEEETTPVRKTRQVTETQAGGKVSFNQFPEEVQRLLLRAEKSRIDEIIDVALDSSDKVRYNLEQYDAKGQKAIRALVEEKVRGRLSATSGDFGDGSHILRDVLPEVEALLEALGSPRRQTPALGMGHAPGGGDIEVYPKKAPDHVSSSDGNFEQHILEKLAFNQGQIERSKR